MRKGPPNIILTIADDQRGSALGCAGLEAVLTPSLDRLAARGTRFSNAHHFGSPHGAICAPSRAMLLTGRPYFDLDPSLINTSTYPPADHSPRIPSTFPQQLRNAGYDTFATGKWHNGIQLFQPAFNCGANLFFGGMADHWFTPVHDFDPTGAYPQEKRSRAPGFSTEVFAQSAIDFIRSRQNNPAPFFCYCAFTAPHDPRTPPDHYRRLYDPGRITLPPNCIADQPFDKGFHGIRHSFDNGSMNMRDEMLLGNPRDPAEIRRSIADYYGMISHMDEWIGRIHNAAMEAGLGENTLVIHTADHGLAVGQHGLMGKQNLYNSSVNVPLLVAGPGIPANRCDHRLCYQHDLNPTLLQQTGLQEKSENVFRNLLPGTPDHFVREYVGTAYSDNQRMIRNHRHKLIEYYSPERRSQLFDLEQDPWETHNLADDPAMSPTMATLREHLNVWQQTVNDPLSQQKR